MMLEEALMQRASAKCELCSSAENLSAYEVKPNDGQTIANSVLVCDKCQRQIANPASTDETSWYALKESMWSEHPAVQVLVYRVLRGLGDNPWAQDLLQQLYLEPETQAWAEAGVKDENQASAPVLDSNGTRLSEGDTVTLIKDLDVKGANFTAKRGTTVKNISLTGDPKYVEGRVNGIRIVLVAAYLKKA